MRLLPVVLTAALLAGCADEREPSVAETTTSRPQTTSSPVAQAKGLTGQVSALNSSVSGLNIRVTDYGTVIDLPADALFAFDSADLTPGAAEQLGKSAQLIRSAPAGTIRIIGHTDAKGDDAYNQTLSQARARTVADWFGQQVGVRQRAFDVTGMGEKAPVAPNQTPTGADDPAGRAKNRRVEVVLPNTP